MFCLITNLNSQRYISFSTDISNEDTLQLCSDQQVNYRAFVVNQLGDTLTGYNIYWDFDNGDIDNQIDMNNYTYQYLTGGFYRLLIIASKIGDTLSFIKPIKVALKPFFSGTKVNLPSNQDGICDGDEVQLISNVQSVKWKEKRKSVYSDAFPVYFDHNYVYSLIISRKNFADTQKITSIDYIDSIGIKIEHSNSSTIKIVIECPNGQKTILKDYGADQHYFGEPIVLSGNFNAGVGYWYWFKTNSTAGNLNSYAGSQTIPSGTFTTEYSLSSLIGCPLDGKWSLKVFDNTNDDHVALFGLGLFI
jgi:subtilisin-like proprotein convertase family protein